MKLAIMQPYFLPYIGYFQAIYAVDKYILYSNVNFSKHSWINRNRVLMKNGNTIIVSAPLISQSSNTLIKSIKIFNDVDWNKRLLKTIYFNYKGAIYFEETYSFLENIFENSFEYLYQLNGYLIESICNFIGIDTTIEYSNLNKYDDLEEMLLEIDKDNYSQFQYLLKTKPEKKVARILELCKSENATTYINAIGGQDLYSKEEFLKYGIDLNFIKTEEFDYPQFNHNFQPNLSIVDVLMHNWSEGTKKLLDKHTLV